MPRKIDSYCHFGYVRFIIKEDYLQWYDFVGRVLNGDGNLAGFFGLFCCWCLLGLKGWEVRLFKLMGRFNVWFQAVRPVSRLIIVCFATRLEISYQSRYKTGVVVNSSYTRKKTGAWLATKRYKIVKYASKVVKWWIARHAGRMHLKWMQEHVLYVEINLIIVLHVVMGEDAQVVWMDIF